VHVIPTGIPHPDRSFVSAVIVNENSLLAIPIGKVAVILVGFISIDNGRLAGPPEKCGGPGQLSPQVNIKRVGLNRYRGSSKTEMLFADPKPLSILQ